MAIKNYVCSAVIREVNEIDISFNVPYGEATNDKLAQSWLLERYNFVSSMFIEPAHTDGLFASAYNPHVDDLFKGIARVADNNEMDIKFELVQPPVLTLVANAVEDTYTRQSKPTINYGTSQTLATGRAADGEYITYIKIDLTSIAALLNSSMNVTAMRLLIGKQASTNGVISLYEVSTNWHENYLLWLNTISSSSHPIFTQTTAGSQIEIDVAEYIRGVVASGVTTMNFMIKSNDFILLNSRESGLAPRIEARYTDPLWQGHTSTTSTSGQAVIKSSKYRDFYNSYRLREVKDLIGSGIRREPNLSEGVAWLNRPFIFGSAQPVVSNYFVANAFVRANTDLHSTAVPNTALGNSQAYIKGRKDMYGIAIVPPDQATWSRIEQAFILKGTWPSSAEVVMSSYFSGSATVRAKNTSSILSAAYPKQDPKGRATFRLNTNIVSSATVRTRALPLDMVSSVQADKPWLMSKYSLRKSRDLVASAFMKAYVPKDTPAQADVQKGWIPGNYQLRVSNSVASQADVVISMSTYGTAIVRRDGLSNLANSFTLGRPLLGYAGIVLHSHKAGTAIVRRDDLLNRPGSATVRRSETYNLSSQGTITGTVYTIGEAIVRRSADTTLLNKAVRRVTAHTEEVGFAEIFRHRNTTASANVYRNKSLVSSVIVRQMDVDHSIWEAFVRGGYVRSHKVSYADIRLKIFHFMSKATIRTGARPWRPNIEGQLVFGDRKLPRQWKRENFIP